MDRPVGRPDQEPQKSKERGEEEKLSPMNGSELSPRCPEKVRDQQDLHGPVEFARRGQSRHKGDCEEILCLKRPEKSE